MASLRFPSCFSLMKKTLQLCDPRILTKYCHVECHESPNCEASPITQSIITKEIKLYRDERNEFTETCFSDTKKPYGPPLAILLPQYSPEQWLMNRCIEFYGEKGFDVVTVNLTSEQFLYPCMAGNAMNVVTELLEYLHEVHKHRPYVFHGFSIGVYIYGEMLAQFSDHYEKHRTLTNNVKCCVWDSPVDVLAVKDRAGGFFYPKNWFTRWRYNAVVKTHFKKHHHDSVSYWTRSRDNFSHPMIKVPNLFLLSCADVLSNPRSVRTVQRSLECNGVPIFQKTWLDSQHVRHLEKYYYEYTYSIIMFFTLGNLFPDECGKYKSSTSTASLSNLRLCKTARDSFR